MYSQSGRDPYTGTVPAVPVSLAYSLQQLQLCHCEYCDGDALEASKEQDPYYAAGCYRHFHFGAQLVV